MTNIRGIDPQLYVRARASAIGQRQPIGEWINDAIKRKLDKIIRRAKK